ncbi:MAG: hypothetical protein J07HQW1_01977 [Haloquadratum walsbyi J07HQW1]|uniref:Uncharacterized protein n=1 Tax=Haloquadratum walsbyi J07HQW1 TaxID=1238424 RepID=U1N692_9EURY|nr:MAG: hypothetical protein J07HQW1_01977 [Haloquadratum walsbyi J07HQW1]
MNPRHGETRQLTVVVNHIVWFGLYRRSRRLPRSHIRLPGGFTRTIDLRYFEGLCKGSRAEILCGRVVYPEVNTLPDGVIELCPCSLFSLNHSVPLWNPRDVITDDRQEVNKQYHTKA